MAMADSKAPLPPDWTFGVEAEGSLLTSPSGITKERCPDPWTGLGHRGVPSTPHCQFLAQHSFSNTWQHKQAESTTPACYFQGLKI